MNQDLMDWLSNDERQKKFEGTGLLLAPIDTAQPTNPEIQAENIIHEEKEIIPESQNDDKEKDSLQSEFDEHSVVMNELQELQETVKQIQDSRFSEGFEAAGNVHEDISRNEQQNEPPMEFWTQKIFNDNASSESIDIEPHASTRAFNLDSGELEHSSFENIDIEQQINSAWQDSARAFNLDADELGLQPQKNSDDTSKSEDMHEDFLHNEQQNEPPNDFWTQRNSDDSTPSESIDVELHASTRAFNLDSGEIEASSFENIDIEQQINSVWQDSAQAFNLDADEPELQPQKNSDDASKSEDISNIFAEQKTDSTQQDSYPDFNFDEPLQKIQKDDDINTSEPDINSAWQNSSTGFILDLSEPPPEIWTRITAHDENEDEAEYEQTESLQGAAYIPVTRSGTNFTQRLQNAMQNRKKRAAEIRRHEEEENAQHHPRRKKVIIMCSVLLAALILSWLGLIYLQRYTPENMNERANNLYQQGKYEESMNLYQKAYKMYPDVLTFLTGFADSAEQAGHVQTANIAREEYKNLMPQEERSSDSEIKEGEEVITEENEPAKDPEILLYINHWSFDDLLYSANDAFNRGFYNSAIINFQKALELQDNDIRPYIGLAGAYRARGMYFDAKRILDDASQKFLNNPTVETELKFLERE